jgi:drug/metabolite transporter, DME family
VKATSDLRRGRLALLAAGILWSLGGIFIKRLPTGSLAITFYRSLFAALVLLPLAAARAPTLRARSPRLLPGVASLLSASPRRPKPPAREMAISVLLFASLLVSFVTATKLTTAANAIILQYTAPIYVIGLSALLLREPPRPADRAALALCMAGVAVLFFGNFRPGGSSAGLALALVSGACFGLFMLWQRRLREVDPVLLAGLNNAGAALVLAVAIPWMGPVDSRSLMLLGVMGTVQIALPYALFTWALQRVPGPEASLLTLIEPVLNPIWVALFAGETPSRATLAGGALILAALALRYAIWGKRGAAPAVSATPCPGD